MPKLYISDVIARPSSRLRPSSFPALAPLADPSPAARRRLRWRPLLCGAAALVPLIIGPVASAQPITDEPPIVVTTGVRGRSCPAVWDSSDLDTDRDARRKFRRGARDLA